MRLRSMEIWSKIRANYSRIMKTNKFYIIPRKNNMKTFQKSKFRIFLCKDYPTIHWFCVTFRMFRIYLRKVQNQITNNLPF